MRVTSNAPEIKITKMNHEVKMEEISTRICSCKEEFMKDTHHGTLKLFQSEYVTILATMAPILDEDASSKYQLKTCLDQLKKQVMKPQTMLEAKKQH